MMAPDRSWHRQRVAALESTLVLVSLLEDPDVEIGRLTVGYLEAKRALASAFEVLGRLNYGDTGAMERAKRSVQSAMDASYSSLPDRYRRVVGFGDVHARLLSYLTAFVGVDVGADALRMLTADAVHTERRARELRDLGFSVVAHFAGGTNVYRLDEPDPDAAEGAAILIRKNIKADRGVGAAEMARLLRVADVADGRDSGH